MSENDVKMPDLSGVFDMISKNPDLIRNAMNAISGMSANDETDNNKEETKATQNNMPDPAAIASLLPMISQNAKPNNNNRGRSNHHELLCALRPYLSPERRSVIDKMLEFGQIGDLLKAFEGKKSSE